jgi:hypothetical protein
MISGELRVASCELRVASCGRLRVFVSIVVCCCIYPILLFQIYNKTLK